MGNTYWIPPGLYSIPPRASSTPDTQAINPGCITLKRTSAQKTGPFGNRNIRKTTGLFECRTSINSLLPATAVFQLERAELVLFSLCETILYKSWPLERAGLWKNVSCRAKNTKKDYAPTLRVQRFKQVSHTFSNAADGWLNKAGLEHRSCQNFWILDKLDLPSLTFPSVSLLSFTVGGA